MREELETLVDNLIVDMDREHHFDVLEDCEKITDLIGAIRKIAIEKVGDFCGGIAKQRHQK